MNAPVTSQNLPALTIQLADERVLAPFMLPPEEAKLKFQMAPLIMLARDNPDLQAMDFINFVRQAQKSGADPERKQIHLITTRKKIKRFDPVQNRQVEEWITKGEAWYAYHFFVAKAQETGELALMDVVTTPCDYLNPATGQMIKNTVMSTATVIRRGKNGEQKYVYRAYFPEFVKTKEIWQNGQPTGQHQVTEAWMSKPYLMLEKCAIANVLRWGFQAELAGMYIPEEMAGEFSPMPVATKEAQPVQTLDATDTQTAPAVEMESQAPVDTEYHEVGQPDAEQESQVAQQVEVHNGKPVVEPPPQQQTPPPAQTTALASNPTKARLWAQVQAAGKRGILNATEAAKKLTTVTLTEALASTLAANLEKGDAKWFHSTH